MAGDVPVHMNAVETLRVDGDQVQGALEDLDQVMREELKQIEDKYLWELDDDFLEDVDEEVSSVARLGPDRVCLLVSVGEFEDYLERAGVRDERIRDAVIDIHRSETESTAIPEERIENCCPLVLWEPDVYRYRETGLSHQQARVMVSLEDASISEVAEALEMSPGTVKSHRHRAMQKIKRCSELVGIHSEAQAELQILINNPNSIVVRRRTDDQASRSVEMMRDDLMDRLRETFRESGLQVTGGGIDTGGRMDGVELFGDEIPQG